MHHEFAHHLRYLLYLLYLLYLITVQICKNLFAVSFVRFPVALHRTLDSPNDFFAHCVALQSTFRRHKASYTEGRRAARKSPRPRTPRRTGARTYSRDGFDAPFTQKSPISFAGFANRSAETKSNSSREPTPQQKGRFRCVSDSERVLFPRTPMQRLLWLLQNTLDRFREDKHRLSPTRDTPLRDSCENEATCVVGRWL